jgi:DNA repair exonuclease SbcCD ATPase subunit
MTVNKNLSKARMKTMAETDVTMRDTKGTIWNALQKANAKLKEMQTKSVDFAAEAKMKKEDSVVAEAEDLAIHGINNAVSSLQKDLSMYLTGLKEDLDERVANLGTLDDAIAVKKRELSELLNIEAEAITLASVVSAKQIAIDDMDAEYGEKLANLQKELGVVRKAIEEAKAAWAEDSRAQREALKQEQARAREEFEYTFKREKQKKEDDLTDALAIKLREHKTEWNATYKELEEREEAVAKRESEVEGLLEQMEELEEKAKEFPTLLQDAVSKARAEAKAEEKKNSDDRYYRDSQQYGTEKSSLQKEIDLLNQTLENERAAHKVTMEKLEKAYERIQNIATASVGSVNSLKTAGMIYTAQPIQGETLK